MKAPVFMAIALLACSLSSWAQNEEQIKISSGQTEREILAKKEFYRYPQFTYGEVHFRSGDKSGAALNYHYLVTAIQFRNMQGDTLNLTDEKNIRFVAIGKDTFFFDKVFLLKTAGDDNLKLAKHQRFTLGNKEKGSAYGYNSGAGAIATYGSMYNTGHISRLTKNESLTLFKEELHFIGDKYNHFFNVTRKNLLRAFPKQKDKLESFLNEKAIAFDKEADLQQLLLFLQSL